jgi:hypothetical protein
MGAGNSSGSIPRIQIKGNGPYRGINGKAKDPDFASMPSLPITTRGHDKGNTGKIDNGRNGVHYLTDAAAINSRTSMALRIAQNQTRQQMTGMQSMHGVAASTLSLDFPLVVPQVSTRIPTLPESLHGIEAERRLFHGLMTAGGFRHSRLHTSAEMQFRNLLRRQIIESLLNSAGPARF